MEEAVSTNAGATWRKVDSGRGTAWWRESWALFMKNPGMWLVYSVIFCLGFAVLGSIHSIGGVIAAVVGQVIAGGWMLAARKLESGGTLEVVDLFAGFRQKLNPLLVLGAFAAGASIVTMLVMVTLGAGAVMSIVLGGARSLGAIVAGAGFGLLAILIGLTLSFLVALAFWAAAALVVLRNVEPVEALKASWASSWGNVGPFVIYGLLWIAAAIVACIPLMLGWIVLLPLTMLGLYCSYQDIFERT